MLVEATKWEKTEYTAIGDAIDDLNYKTLKQTKNYALLDNDGDRIEIVIQPDGYVYGRMLDPSDDLSFHSMIQDTVPVGRPRKEVDPSLGIKPKRGRGRPRKVSAESLIDEVIRGKDVFDIVKEEM
jgi:hypothetical protein